ncbi:MAG: PepSY-associated TM helix domain-containing protein [Nostoc sp.]|uniref:PepSY domain-containing protein n=1 Tax=unclassified Nostoc TaxID=2593658 RepID=UPI0025D0327E|nr:PepSY-associated TM helix domain-containing protein [Nostoc sp. NMS7]
MQLKNALKSSGADRFLDAFAPMHYGTFGGLPTRILYVFVGLGLSTLSITGFIMWWYRYKGKNPKPQTQKMVEPASRS